MTLCNKRLDNAFVYEQIPALRLPFEGIWAVLSSWLLNNEAGNRLGCVFW